MARDFGIFSPNFLNETINNLQRLLPQLVLEIDKKVSPQSVVKSCWDYEGLRQNLGIHERAYAV